MAPTFLQSLVVRASLLISLSCWIIQGTRLWSGRWFGRYFRGPTLLPNRHRKNPVAICPGICESWRLHRYLQGCGKRNCWQCSQWCVPCSAIFTAEGIHGRSFSGDIFRDLRYPQANTTNPSTPRTCEPHAIGFHRRSGTFSALRQ